jgi:NAD-dependent deacetylase
MRHFDIPAVLIETLKNSQHVAAMTGAGVSAESGVPTFREAQTGLWEQYDPTELATPQAFQRDPKLVWDWYQWRREKVLSVTPNPGHFALVTLSQLFPRFTLITQNVDGLHQNAGSPDVVELHGSLLRAKCFDRNHLADSWPDDSLEQPPRCAICQSLMRPDVVWFNEQLPDNAIETAFDVARTCDVFLSIGTSSVVHPAAALATIAADRGATVVEINPNQTPLTARATFALHGPSGEILPELASALSTNREP